MSRIILAELLKRKKLSKRQFAKRLDIAYPTVFRYFRPGYDPKLSVLARWAKVLSCRIRDLLEE